MAAGFKLRVITPEALFYEGTADSVILETVDGFMGFLAGRAPACVLLAAEGKLRFREKKEEDDSGKGKDTAEENNMHKPVSYTHLAMIGLIMLVGIIVNNGIVLVDYINQLRAKGVPKREAILEAGATRMRPVLMTSLTTVLGLIIMAVGKTAGTDMMQPIALVCIGGLVYATVLTLFVVPIMYDLFNGEDFKMVKEEDIDVSDIVVE